MTTTSDMCPQSGSEDMMARYARVRERSARILYVRNRLAGEVNALRAQLALLRGGNTQACILQTHLARAERELDDVRKQAEDAKASLVAVLSSMRAMRRDRLHALAGDLATADAAESELDADSLDRRFHALGVR